MTILYKTYDEDVLFTQTDYTMVPPRGDIFEGGGIEYLIDKVVWHKSGSEQRGHVVLYLVECEEQPKKPKPLPVSGHILDFDENGNWYLVPTNLVSDFYDWIETHRINFDVQPEDLLPGMIQVNDPDKVVITDYAIINS